MDREFNLSQPHSLALMIQRMLWTPMMGVQREVLEVGVRSRWGLGPSGGLGIFPCGHRHWGHILGTHKGGSGNGQGPESLLLALPMPIAPEGLLGWL